MPSDTNPGKKPFLSRILSKSSKRTSQPGPAKSSVEDTGTSGGYIAPQSTEADHAWKNDDELWQSDLPSDSSDTETPAWKKEEGRETERDEIDGFEKERQGWATQYLFDEHLPQRLSQLDLEELDERDGRGQHDNQDEREMLSTFEKERRGWAKRYLPDAHRAVHDRNYRDRESQHADLERQPKDERGRQERDRRAEEERKDRERKDKERSQKDRERKEREARKAREAAERQEKKQALARVGAWVEVMKVNRWNSLENGGRAIDLTPAILRQLYFIKWNFVKHLPTHKIRKIQYVMNDKLYAIFNDTKNKLRRHGKSTQEMLLFHGTKPENINKYVSITKVALIAEFWRKDFKLGDKMVIQLPMERPG